MRHPSLALVSAVVLFAVEASAADKTIRLRNETITPGAPDRSAPAALKSAPAAPASGLFLIQFEAPLRPVWRNALSARGVEFIRYVPDDACIARLSGANLNALKALPFVRWVGEFRPEHKIHPRLHLPGPVQLGGDAEVSVLLSPSATAAEIAEARGPLQGASVVSVPRLGTVLRGKLAHARVNALAQSQGVLWVEPAPKMRLYDEVSSRLVGGAGSGHNTAVMDLGYDGSGVTVAVADSGLDSGEIDSMHPDIAGRVTALFYYGALEDAADEHSHGTHCAGIIAGNGAVGEVDENGFLYGLGVAPGANLIGQRLFGAEGNYEPPPTFEAMTRHATRAGADIGSNSWGDDTQGGYDLSAAEFDALVRDADLLTPGDQQYILEFSAGNAGPGYRTVGSPAVAKNVIATGASQNSRFNLPLDEFAIYSDGPDAMADFSSRGPCADGRIKPDVVAPGTWIASLRSIYANDDFAWWPISDSYLYQGGTSQAGPQVSGAAAVFVQFYREQYSSTPSPALVKAALINSAVDMDDFAGTGPTPNADEGWGRVDLTQLIGTSRDLRFSDQQHLLQTGQTNTQRIVVADSLEPLKITLAYTDVPGFPGAIPALVNDLDLEVVGPDGTFYRGNQMEEGESVPNPPSADDLNNVEAVHLYEPLPGEYTIHVIARNVVEDARSDTDGVVDQDFAMVISAAIAPAGYGVVTFDRPAYTAPGLIRLRLVDHDLAGQPSATVSLRSSTEPDGELITLLASGTTGVFTANVATITSPAAADGRLHISHGSPITAIYGDANPPAQRAFTSVADLLPPVISGIFATNQFGATTVSFTTDEDAIGTVQYGTSALTASVSERFADWQHELLLTNITPNLLYHYQVVAVDLAGNRATNGNLSFIAAQPPTVLLVDAYHDDFFDFAPLTGYTAALDQLGVSYEVFDATTGASPSLQVLQAHRCVIWRFTEFAFFTPTITEGEIAVLTNYLAGGGSLFVASMEFLTRLEEAGFTTFARDWLQVQSYVPDLGAPQLVGASSDPVGLGIDLNLDYSIYDNDLKAIVGITADASDTVSPTTNGAAVFYTTTSQAEACGVRAPKPGRDLPWRVVYLSTAFDAIPHDGSIGNNRAGVLRNILSFLVPPVGNSTLTLDSDVYSVPGRVIVEVEDADLAGHGNATATFTGPHQAGSVAVNLRETTRPGLFRGTLALVAAGAVSSAAELQAQPGDTIQAQYADASSGLTLQVSAFTENTPPAINLVDVLPDYLDAFVSWSTSEPADSLVQFSDFPGDLAPTNDLPIHFTAYDGNLVTDHELALGQLLPDHTYYFRVVSRDKAGNVTVDDNAGELYTFTTLAPVLPPWSDDAENGVRDWQVITADESDAGWTLGVPGNGEIAHSPTTCWGTGFGPFPASLAESYLLTPGIYLSGGNKAKLRFWQNYDFLMGETDIEFGELRLYTDPAATTYVTLAQVSEFSGGWEEVEFDLTPYLGKLVYVAWYYFVFTFENAPHFGWMVDDVSLEVTYEARGTVEVTNNLSTAVMVVTGPTSRSGRGNSLMISNAVPGRYVVEFSAVPYYVAPAPQTNTLISEGVLRFEGIYTFPDTNGNGLSDLWEDQFFGGAAPNHPPSIDSDGDGMSDEDEFAAGTNPTNSVSVLRAAVVTPTNGVVHIRWTSAAGRSYRVLGSDDLVTWTPVTDWRLVSRTGTQAEALPLPPGASSRFYRLEVKP